MVQSLQQKSFQTIRYTIDVMFYYEVWVASTKYKGKAPLTYCSKEELAPLAVVSVPLRGNLVTGFVVRQVPKPDFIVKEVKAVLSQQPLPRHCFELAQWLSSYYHAGLGEALRQFAPSAPAVTRRRENEAETGQIQEELGLDSPLTAEQSAAISYINNQKSTTVLLHGETGSGKTRVYLELAKKTILAGKSVILLTPEIGLTSQLAEAAASALNCPIHILHSEMTPASRKKTWFKILESQSPSVVIGPRSALFAPLAKLGLIVVDESHETAYKQEQSPYYHAVRVASRLGGLVGAKVILGSATPSIEDYYLAQTKNSIFTMRLQAKSQSQADLSLDVVDLKDKSNLSKSHYVSDPLIKQMSETLAAHKQTLLYYNRRGTARLILCANCGWQLLCPNCDIPLVYHGDQHETRCHTCAYKQVPPSKCPVCTNPEIIYTSIGTKALTSFISNLFPSAEVNRFDSDNTKGERLNEVYAKVKSGVVDILIGTQLIAKGLDLPKLKLVGIILADSSLLLPDFTAQERTFQLLHQVIGRVGRHGPGKIVIQTFEPDSFVIKAATKRDYKRFYDQIIEERRQFRFPPFSYLMKLTCRRASESGAKQAAVSLKNKLAKSGLPVEVIGPTPSFRQRIGRNYYYQIVARSKNRNHLLELAEMVPPGWSVDLDPINLL